MANRTWGLLCPEDGGLLIERDEWTRQGVAWCPNNDHTGNGRFWRRQEVEEGWFDPTRPPAPTEAHLARVAKAAQQAAEREQYTEAQRIADAKGKRRMTDSDATKTPKAAKPPQNCLCGCGGQTKGGRFIPGHDARYHSRIRTLEAAPHNLSHDEAAKIASKGPLTGKYAVKPAPVKAEKPAAAAKAPRAAKPKPVDLTAKATDDPAPETEGETTEAPADIEV
jgi:hypothetical protein